MPMQGESKNLGLGAAMALQQSRKSQATVSGF
jgi:hypothetical protein